YTLNFWVPFELNSAGYCSIPSLSAAAQPSLQLTLNASASVYQTTTVTTAAVFEIKAYSEFWTVPVNHAELGPQGPRFVGAVELRHRGPEARELDQHLRDRAPGRHLHPHARLP